MSGWSGVEWSGVGWNGVGWSGVVGGVMWRNVVGWGEVEWCGVESVSYTHLTLPTSVYV